jgi:hypothetical protein
VNGVGLVKSLGTALAVAALVIFVLGGLATFTGLALLAFFKNQVLFGLGDGRSMGVSLVIVGLISSVAGVLMMRIYRNRI